MILISNTPRLASETVGALDVSQMKRVLLMLDSLRPGPRCGTEYLTRGDFRSTVIPHVVAVVGQIVGRSAPGGVGVVAVRRVQRRSARVVLAGRGLRGPTLHVVRPFARVRQLAVV